MIDYALQDKNLTKRVLLADDDNEHTMLLHEAFSQVAPQTLVNVVQNGNQVIHFLKNSPALPDMIVMDIHMPGKCGIETLKEIKSQDGFRSIPVIIFSASKKPQDIYECYRHNASCVMKKPNDYKGLVEIAQTIDLLMKRFY